MNKVDYLELDVSDGQYKYQDLIKDQYFCGELFIGSAIDKPAQSYLVKVHLNDKIEYFSLVAINDNEYELRTKEGSPFLPCRIIFEAVKLSNVISLHKFNWLLKEKIMTSIILDYLELHFDFNILGDSTSGEFDA